MSEVPDTEIGKPGFSLSHTLYDRECLSALPVPERPPQAGCQKGNTRLSALGAETRGQTNACPQPSTACGCVAVSVAVCLCVCGCVCVSGGGCVVAPQFPFLALRKAGALTPSPPLFSEPAGKSSAAVPAAAGAAAGERAARGRPGGAPLLRGRLQPCE